MQTERRNLSSVGRKRRRDFDRSMKKLRDLGMPDWAVEYYRRVARVAGLPPHMVVCHVAVIVAGQQLTPNVTHTNRETGTDVPEEPVNGFPAAPASPLVQPREQGGINIWRGIQRRASRLSMGFTRVFAPQKRGEMIPDTTPPAAPEHAAPIYIQAEARPDGKYTPPPRRIDGLSRTP